MERWYWEEKAPEGEVFTDAYGAESTMRQSCFYCYGTGEDFTEACLTCGGLGWVCVAKSMMVK